MPKEVEKLAVMVEIDLLATDDLVRVRVVDRSGDSYYGSGPVLAVGYVDKPEDAPEIFSREWPHIVRIMKADAARRALEEGEKA